MKVIRARAPLRLGLAGGGTDVSPYCDQHGGAVLNVTIDRFAFASLTPRDDGRIVFRATDLQAAEEHAAAERLPDDEGLRLHRGVYNRMVSEFGGGRPMGLTLTTYVESPLGSGLGSSSALVVAMVEAFRETLNAPLGEYDVARIAFEVERIELALNGGRQDQYAATFGGFNFIEFSAGERVVVNPLRIKQSVVRELEASIVLFSTGASRESARIIDQQAASVSAGGAGLDAMHRVKAEAIAMKEALLFGRVRDMAEILNRGWEAKKETSAAISNPQIERVYAAAKAEGALAGKVSGAGGGGFMVFLVEPERRAAVLRRLSAEPGCETSVCRFTADGAATWRADG